MLPPYFHKTPGGLWSVRFRMKSFADRQNKSISLAKTIAARCGIWPESTVESREKVFAIRESVVKIISKKNRPPTAL